MGYDKEFYLVRHGNYDWTTGGLDAVGRIVDAPKASRHLVDRGLGTRAVLLSSDARRAAETAKIIGDTLGTEPVLSPTINQAGNEARDVHDLDAVIERALQEEGVEIDGTEQDLVVVTHAPMLAIARRVSSMEIGYGEVFTYQRNTWNNPYVRR